MKVIVKSTGKIKEVTRGIYSPYQFVDKEGTIYREDDVEELSEGGGVILIDPTIDYWTRLEHQYAGMAMQGLLANHYITDRIDVSVLITEAASTFAKSLVEKARYEENPKELEGLKKELEALKIEKTILENKIKLLTEESK